jgi:hypothetical protein
VARVMLFSQCVIGASKPLSAIRDEGKPSVSAAVVCWSAVAAESGLAGEVGCGGDDGVDGGVADGGSGCCD